jgi:selenocysteine lyase/cysteine desulfurase
VLDLTRIRSETPGVAHRIHLNNAGAGLLSDRTLRAISDHLHLEAEIGGYEAEDLRRDEIEETYQSVARLLGARRDEIALFDNSSHAWNAAFYSIPFEPGDRILTGHAEYGSNALAYLQMAKRRGVVIDVVPNDPFGQLDVQALADRIDGRTRLIGMSHIPTSGGLVNPAAEVGRLARAAGVLYLLDATQTAGQLPIDVDEVGADLVTATGRKFLRGPRGTGFLYVRTAVLDRLDPFVNDIGASTWDGATGFEWHEGARRFGTWEHSYGTVLGLGSAVDQALEVGLEPIAERALALGGRLRDGLDAIPGVRTHDLGRVRCAIVTASLEGVPAAAFATAIRARGINVSLTAPKDNVFDERRVHPLVRLSPHYYNSEEEIDTALDAVATIAAGWRDLV